ncbi:unnamed protein product [Prorocentrum cordatum]|uniref:Translation initiation factor beta propellor-like domain-containing protein n=1 Tax=Prorocentrum cordatum TaxID=2364126 RepID=A0ABN9W828_9DINO|nr:unnamed protein product [Polarella glacialis]
MACAAPPAAMEIVAVAKDGVHIYQYQPGDEVGPPAHSFPAVPTAEGCVWSADGALLALVDPSTGGAVVYSAAEEYAELCRVPPLTGDQIRNMYFSPAGNHLVTYERYVKDAGNNVGVWNARTGESRFAFTLKQQTSMNWPPLKWTSLETHCCRMVQDGVVITGGGCQKGGDSSKIEAPGIMAFEVAPRGAGTGPPHIAICIAESKGAPARCQIFNLESPSRPTAVKNFFKAQTVQMLWNNTGSALLVKSATEVDESGKSYYGGNHLYFLRADGEESSIVANPDEGLIHDVSWSPTQADGAPGGTSGSRGLCIVGSATAIWAYWAGGSRRWEASIQWV